MHSQEEESNRSNPLFLKKKEQFHRETTSQNYENTPQHQETQNTIKFQSTPVSSTQPTQNWSSFHHPFNEMIQSSPQIRPFTT